MSWSDFKDHITKYKELRWDTSCLPVKFLNFGYFIYSLGAKFLNYLLKKLLINRQILLVRILGNVLRIVRRICILMFACKVLSCFAMEISLHFYISKWFFLQRCLWEKVWHWQEEGPETKESEEISSNWWCEFRTDFRI